MKSEATISLHFFCAPAKTDNSSFIAIINMKNYCILEES
jgi:hypothetical protein